MQVFMRLHAFVLTGFANPSTSRTSTPNAAIYAPSMDGEEIASAGETSAVHQRASNNGAGTSAGEDRNNRWSSSTTITAIDLHIASIIFYI